MARTGARELASDTTDAWRQSLAGLGLMCVGVAFLCVNDAFAKMLTDRYSPLQILFLRNVIALPFALLLALRMGGPSALRTRRPAAHLLRGGLWIGGTVLFFTSFRYLDLAEATALIFVAPVFITALSAVLLREPVGWRRWLAVLAGFLGVVIVVQPGGAAFQPASLLPVGAALFYALLLIGARWVDPRESVWTLQLYLAGASALISAFLVPFVWVPIRPEDIWFFLGVAAFGTAAITMMTQAFRIAPAALIAPIDYTALVWATLLGWLVWGEIPGLATYAGAAVIIASGVYIVLRERKLNRRKG